MAEDRNVQAVEVVNGITGDTTSLAQFPFILLSRNFDTDRDAESLFNILESGRFHGGSGAQADFDEDEVTGSINIFIYGDTFIEWKVAGAYQLTDGIIIMTVLLGIQDPTPDGTDEYIEFFWQLEENRFPTDRRIAFRARPNNEYEVSFGANTYTQSEWNGVTQDIVNPNPISSFIRLYIEKNKNTETVGEIYEGVFYPYHTISVHDTDNTTGSMHGFVGTRIQTDTTVAVSSSTPYWTSLWKEVTIHSKFEEDRPNRVYFEQVLRSDTYGGNIDDDLDTGDTFYWESPSNNVKVYKIIMQLILDSGVTGWTGKAYGPWDESPPPLFRLTERINNNGRDVMSWNNNADLAMRSQNGLVWQLAGTETRDSMTATIWLNGRDGLVLNIGDRLELLVINFDFSGRDIFSHTYSLVGDMDYIEVSKLD